MSLLRLKNAQIREKRLNALGAYLGDINTILEELTAKYVKQRVRTFSQNTFDEIIYVLRVISKIYDTVTVIHGPRGCGAAGLFFGSAGESELRYAVTDLDERDVIVGGEAKLRDAVISLYKRYQPEIVFIVSTPAVAINNDDIQAVIDELKEELDVDIVPIYTDGFKSKNSITGYDAVQHALAKYLQGEQVEAKEAYVNLLAVNETTEDIKEISRLLDALGLKVNVLPRFAKPQNFGRVAGAKASVSINPDYGDYLGRALEEKHNVPFLQPSLPVGIKGTHEWLTEVARFVGKEKEAEDLQAREIGALDIAAKSKIFDGLKVYINLPTSIALDVSQLIGELGGEVVGLTVEHVDELHKEKLAALLQEKPDLQLHVANGQVFEEANLLKRLQPYLYIGEQPVWAAKAGIPAVTLERVSIIGYQGINRFIHRITKVLRNSFLIDHLAKDELLPYQQSWYQKSPQWYIKQEVK